MTVQDIVSRIRRHECSTGQVWPGDLKRPVRTRFPNLCAEIAAEEYFLWCPAGHARITEELLADVLEAGEILTVGELRGLCGLFRCEMGYLTAELAIVDPSNNKGKRRRRQLLSAAEAFHAVVGESGALQDSFDRMRGRSAERTEERLKNGEQVTYAEYRRAMRDLQSVRHRLTQREVRGRRAS